MNEPNFKEALWLFVCQLFKVFKLVTRLEHATPAVLGSSAHKKAFQKKGEEEKESCCLGVEKNNLFTC